MPFSAKVAAPCLNQLVPPQPALERAAAGGVTVCSAPSGYLLPEALAAALYAQDRPTIWLRLGPEDRDPATFLLSLINGAQQLCPSVGAATREQMRRHPGPASGWSHLFARLACELADSLPPHSALVLENSHFLNETQPTLGLVSSHLLPDLPENVAVILTSSEPLHSHALPQGAALCGVADLRLTEASASQLLRAAALSPANAQRLIRLTGGNGAVIVGLCAVSELLGPTVVQTAIDQSRSAEELLARSARLWAATTSAAVQQALALALRLGYVHPALAHTALGHPTVPSGPWLQPLAGGWAQLHASWHAPLRAALRASATLDSETLCRAADYLVEQGAVEQAVALYFEIGYVARATEVISGTLDRLMNQGQWETLHCWIDQLPAPALRAHPWLVYSSGELAAMQGQASEARRTFAAAASLFTAQNDNEGACQSLLAESALAAWEGNTDHALGCARSAHTLASSAKLLWQQGWAAWQLGCLAAAASQLDDALVYFGDASHAIAPLNQALVEELIQEAEELTLRRRDLRRQRDFHHQAYWLAEQAERAAAQQLSSLLSFPPGNLDELLGAHGWVHTPLMLKLSTIPAPAETAPAPEQGFWSRLLGALRLRRRIAQEERPTLAQPARIAAAASSHLSLPAVPALTTTVETALVEALPVALIEQAVGATPPAPWVALAEPEPAPTPAPTPALAQPAVPEVSTHLTLSVQLLGPFRVTLNDKLIENWPSGRGRAVFKYLLTHRDRQIARDVLMDLFWPSAEPEAARNNLNVAIHGLRQALRSATDLPVVQFRNGGYGLNTDLTVWLDTDEFERNVQSGQRLEAAGQLSSAITHYEAAISLYQGDFLEDDPYEDWPVLTREQLKDAYMATLDRLSQIAFSQGQYSSCVAFCQRLLACDNLREDIHARLMRCYARQDQHNLALRQYHQCAEILQAELSIAPAPATTQLCEKIRRRERV